MDYVIHAPVSEVLGEYGELQEKCIRQAHIPIAWVFAENRVIYLRFKKNKSDLYETITLDQFLALVINKVNEYEQESYRNSYFRD